MRLKQKGSALVEQSRAILINQSVSRANYGSASEAIMDGVLLPV